MKNANGIVRIFNNAIHQKFNRIASTLDVPYQHVFDAWLWLISIGYRSNEITDDMILEEIIHDIDDKALISKKD